MEPCTVDLIIADPPYNLNKDFGEWNESEKKDVWLTWSHSWLDECNRVLKPNGSIFVYGIHHHLCWLQCYMYELGKQIFDSISEQWGSRLPERLIEAR